MVISGSTYCLRTLERTYIFYFYSLVLPSKATLDGSVRRSALSLQARTMTSRNHFVAVPICNFLSHIFFLFCKLFFFYLESMQLRINNFSFFLFITNKAFSLQLIDTENWRHWLLKRIHTTPFLFLIIVRDLCVPIKFSHYTGRVLR